MMGEKIGHYDNMAKLYIGKEYQGDMPLAYLQLANPNNEKGKIEIGSIVKIKPECSGLIQAEDKSVFERSYRIESTFTHVFCNTLYSDVDL